MSGRAIGGGATRGRATSAGRREPAVGSRVMLLLAFALAGCGISLYLGAYQLGLIHRVWDPLFDRGSALVLTSVVSRLLPVPDALLGAAVYAVDAVLVLALAAGPARPAPLATALAAIATAGALVGIGLAIAQPLVAHTFCTLCLTSTAISIALAIGAGAEARAVHRSSQEVQP